MASRKNYTPEQFSTQNSIYTPIKVDWRKKNDVGGEGAISEIAAKSHMPAQK